jgi:hypothetical protein
MFIDIEQNTDEWLGLRAGHLTGSAIAKVMANFGKAFGDPAKKLAVDIALEQVTGKCIPSGYSNDHMARGHEQEPLARALYESEHFCTVNNGGFYDNGFTGCSPDGNRTDGLVEIKSVIPSVHYQRIKKGGFDTAYRWQLMFNLKESGKEWIDFISYCDNFTADKRLYVFRINAEEQAEDFEKMAIRIAEFKRLVDEVKRDLTA